MVGLFLNMGVVTKKVGHDVLSSDSPVVLLLLQFCIAFDWSVQNISQYHTMLLPYILNVGVVLVV